MIGLILVPLLVLSIIDIGKCATPVACSSDNKVIRYTEHGRTASYNNWKWITSIALNVNEEVRQTDCRKKCEKACVDGMEGGPHFNRWPGCKAFSSYSNPGGGTCYCYGWNTKPAWYSSDRYRSGWCETA